MGKKRNGDDQGGSASESERGRGRGRETASDRGSSLAGNQPAQTRQTDQTGL